MLPLLEEAYVNTGKLQIVYKEYPVVNGDLSVVASLASECAAKQDMFWPMHAWLFENSNWKSPDALEIFGDAAEELGLDRESFTACVQEQSSIDPIVEDYQEGQIYGIRGTPNFVVNGHLLQGLLPTQQLMDIIDALLIEAETGALPSNVATVTPSPTPDTDFEPETVAPRGSADAPVVIVEFSDYQCPYCLSHYNENMPQLLKDYIDTGKVQYVFKDFPLSEIHPQAQLAAEAAECAGVQDVYWEMHDKLFGQQAQWSNNANAGDVFKQFADDLGLDAEAFAECLDGGQFTAEVEADLFEGIDAGVTGTPGFFINGQFLGGFRPYSDFQAVIDGLLAANN
ncbi:MAG: thioredoxin domain-containing protein [Caldilineales bacterium]|nr:thioredoxin domain-containing protein [Caldilineales bacterium]